MIPELIEISKQNRAVLNPAYMLDIVETRPVINTPERLECRGIGLWSDTSRGPIKFFVHLEFGKWWLQYEPAT